MPLPDETHVETHVPCRHVHDSQSADDADVTGKGEREETEWLDAEENPDHDISPPSSPVRDFAPRGLPKVRRRFRDKLPKPLRLDDPDVRSNAYLENIQNHASPFLETLRLLIETVTSSIDCVPSAAFLERLRLAIVQSQLLDNPLVVGVQPAPEPGASPFENEPSPQLFSTSGAVAAIVFGFGAATLIRWFWLGGIFPTWRRLLSSFAVSAAVFLVARAYVRRELLKSVQEQGLDQATRFIALSKEFDGVNSAALNFIMEVELVSRGYRL